MSTFSGFIFSNLFVSFVLSALAARTYTQNDLLTFDWIVICSIFTGSWFLYSFHRLYKIGSIPEAEKGARHLWVEKNQQIMKVFMALAAGVGVFLLVNLDFLVILWLIPAGIISLAYTIPIIPTGPRWIKMREIPFAKPFIISGIVSYLTLSFPMLAQMGYEDLMVSAHLLEFLERFLFILAVTIPFEIRDKVADKSHGLRTIATVFGTRQSVRIAMGVSAIWFLFFLWVGKQDIFDFAIRGSLILLLVVGALYGLPKMRKEEWIVLSFEGLIVVYSIV